MTYDRLLWALILALLVGVAFHRVWVYETDIARFGVVMKKHPGRESVVWISPLCLPLTFLLCGLVLAVVGGPALAGQYMLHFSLDLIVQFSLYFLVLLLVLPLLRRFFSARACATLWLLPVFLYWLLYIYTYSYTPPLVVLRVPQRALELFVVVWIVGFFAVMFWRCAAHLAFRRRVLQDAYAVTDPDVLRLWDAEQALAERKYPVELQVSPAVSSPLTIGLFRSSMRTLLPERHYSADELRLIFRHELRHIQRRDIDTKVFLALCQAFCWFNPLVWLAVRKASADLELSCDEMVLYGADEPQRRQYAELLLSQAGDGRGFTSCLSASAEALRHRLKNIVRPRRRLPGSALLAAVMAALTLCSGFLTVSGQYGTLGELVLSQLEDPQLDTVTLERDDMPGSTRYVSVYAWDEPALLGYLSSLPLTKIAVGQSAPEDSGPGIFLAFQTANGLAWVDVAGEFVLVSGKGVLDRSGLYRLDGTVDWELVSACLDFDAPDPDPSPQPPGLMLWFMADGQAVSDGPIWADAHRLRVTDPDGVRTPDADLPISGNGVDGFAVTQVRLELTYPPADGCTVTVEGLDGQGPYDAPVSDDGVLALAPYSARYTVRGTFESTRDTVYDMAFYFEVHLPE